MIKHPAPSRYISTNRFLDIAEQHRDTLPDKRELPYRYIFIVILLYVLLAEHYDSLAAQTIKPYWSIDHHNHMLQEALSQYHNLYTLWRDNDFSPIMFASMTNSIRSTMSFPV